MLEDNLKNDADPKSEDYLREESDSKSVTTSKKKNPICNLKKEGNPKMKMTTKKIFPSKFIHE